MTVETLLRSLETALPSTIPWAYSIAMILAAVVFVVIDRWQPKSAAVDRLSSFQKWTLVGAAFVGGSLGGKLPFALATGQWWTTQAWFMDGKTITTGLVGAYLMVELCKWLQGIRIKTGDRFALPLAGALAVGRWGCFFNGCCFGTTTELPWGVEFLGQHGPRHPTQIYESLFHATMLILLVLATRWRMWERHRLQVYLLSYCGFRFLSEWIRPEPDVLWRLTFYQWVVLGFAVLLILQWAFEQQTDRPDTTSAHS